MNKLNKTIAEIILATTMIGALMVFLTYDIVLAEVKENNEKKSQEIVEKRESIQELKEAELELIREVQSLKASLDVASKDLSKVKQENSTLKKKINLKSKPATAKKISNKSYKKSANVDLGRQMNASKFGDQHWNALYQLWTHESGWNHLAVNRSSGACGIPQSLPCSKMSTHGADYRTNPQTQISWGLSYIAGRYGNPTNAWAHFQRKNWY